MTAQEEEESPALDSADAGEGQESAESADTDESGDGAGETADGQAAADAGSGVADRDGHVVGAGGRVRMAPAATAAVEQRATGL